MAAVPVPVRGPSGLLAEDALMAMTGQVAEAAGATRDCGWFPLLPGGDCPVILGALAALQAEQGICRDKAPKPGPTVIFLRLPLGYESTSPESAAGGKHAALHDRDVLMLNRQLPELAQDGWEDDHIKARAEHLANLITRIWPAL